MDNLDEMLYLKGITLSNEQRIAFNKCVESITIFCNDLQAIVNTIFQEQFKPILEQIKEIVKRNPKVSVVKYGIIKIIKPIQYSRLKKPRLIHCRTNC
jgi:uncharacterized hydantoinase/oxoprolinase family protein